MCLIITLPNLLLYCIHFPADVLKCSGINATQYNTLQHATTHCNTLQHTLQRTLQHTLCGRVCVYVSCWFCVRLCVHVCVCICSNTFFLFCNVLQCFGSVLQYVAVCCRAYFCILVIYMSCFKAKYTHSVILINHKHDPFQKINYYNYFPPAIRPVLFYFFWLEGDSNFP